MAASHAKCILSARLHDETTPHRYELIVALASQRKREATQVLLAFAERGGHVRQEVFAALRDSDEPLARQTLIAVASDSDDPAADVALRALTGKADPTVRTLMVDALHSDQAERMYAAIDYFAMHSDPAAVPELLEIVAQGEPRSTNHALSALMQLGSPDAVSALRDLAATRGHYQGSALAMLHNMKGADSDTTRELALQIVQDGGPATDHALQLLVEDRSPEATHALLQAAQRGGPTSYAATSLLGRRPGPETTDLLSKLSRGDDPQQRDLALTALAEQRTEESFRALEQVLKSDDSQQRIQALSVLGIDGGEQAERALLAATDDEDEQVALSAIGQLGQLPSETAIEKLEHFAKHGQGSTQGHALQALAEASPKRATALVEELLAGTPDGDMLPMLTISSLLPPQVASKVIGRGLSSEDPQLVEYALYGFMEGADPKQHRAALERIAGNTNLSEDIRERAGAWLVDH